MAVTLEQIYITNNGNKLLLKQHIKIEVRLFNEDLIYLEIGGVLENIEIFVVHQVRPVRARILSDFARGDNVQ